MMYFVFGFIFYHLCIGAYFVVNAVPRQHIMDERRLGRPLPRRVKLIDCLLTLFFWPYSVWLDYF